MTPAQFIDNAIGIGASAGLAALTPVQRMVFLISEAEVYCDKDGIDSFLDRYGTSGIKELAVAFREVGALSITEALFGIVSHESAHEAFLARANVLITGRAGYDYNNIERMVASRLSTGEL